MNRFIPPTAAAALLVVAFASTPALAQSSGPFANCPAAYAAGRANIPKGDPAYADHLDGHSQPGEPDGVACEDPPWGTGPAPTTPTTTEPEPETPATTTAPPTTRQSTGAVTATPKYTG